MTRIGALVLNKSAKAPVAYAMLPNKEGYGRFHAVELHNVTYEKVRHLEPNEAPERAGMALGRIVEALNVRTILSKLAPDWYTATMRRGR